MAMKKVSVTLDEDLVAEIKTELGEGEFSAYLNDVLDATAARTTPTARA